MRKSKDMKISAAVVLFSSMDGKVKLQKRVENNTTSS